MNNTDTEIFIYTCRPQQQHNNSGTNDDNDDTFSH